MVGNVYAKNIKRTIFGSMGRYMAILAIIALGVGFFVGVKNTKASMIETCDQYMDKFSLYDYRVISTYGFTDDDVRTMGELSEVFAAEGGIYADFFSEDRGGNSIILRAHSITEDINKLNLVEGRMPDKPDECVADGFYFTEKDIGKTVKIADKNQQTDKDALEYGSYKIVGLARSPYYIMKGERGTTSLGDGKISAVIYMPREGFTSEYFSEIYVTCKAQGYVFSQEYDENVGKVEKTIENTAESRAQARYDDIVDDAQEQIDKGKAELEEGRATFASEKNSAYSKLRNAKYTLDAKSRELSEGKTALAGEKAGLESKRTEASAALTSAKAALAQAQAQQDQQAIAIYTQAVAQAESALSQIDGGLSAISAKEREIAAGEAEIAAGYEEYRAGMARADREFADAERELNDAEEKLKTSQKELEDMAAAEVFMQTREDNLGFTSFESNSDIVDSIAKVFPVFFFLIAALVCSTTMSRMIEEERTQIGALRAIGYTSGRIMLKYMVYSGSAAVIGCIVGFLAGSKYFPVAIWTAYGMMFGFAPLEYYFNWPLAVISLIVSLICSTGTTYFACRGQLSHMPAEILRPKAPKAGKRVILERVGFIWSRMRFLHKVTARNILRYKKRMIMMILGIGGCASLVLAGLGLQDSIAGISDHQYDNIEKYDVMVAFEKELTEESHQQFQDKYEDELRNTAVFQQSTVTLKNNGVVKSSSLIVTDDENMTGSVIMREPDNDMKNVPMPGDGEAVINNKMAEMLGVEIGDEVTVEYSDTNSTTIKVSGIYRNYVHSYMFINSETYKETSGEEYAPTMMYLTFRDGTDVHEAADDISDSGDIIAISVNEDVRERIDEMMLSLNYIIILVILCAGALAFIVLFNLSNINMTERVREIATIEVLGFYPRETGAYVFRESLILAVLGIIAGLPTGIVLHRFIMEQINVDMVSFNETIDPVSYIYAVVIVLCFTFIVDRIMRRKLKRINMAEALKSIE